MTNPETEKINKVKSTLEHFREIISLEGYISVENAKINEQIQRKQHLESQQSVKASSLSDSTEKKVLDRENLKNKEKELFDLEKKLESNQVQLNQVTDQNTLKKIENNIKEFQESRDLLEEEVLLLMEGLETLEGTIKELEEFQHNIVNTIGKIDKEIFEIRSTAESEIKNYENRISLILDQMKEEDLGDFRQKYDRLKDKGFCCFYKNNRCEKCGRSITGAELMEFQKRLIVASCKGCQRYLIP